MFKSSTPVRRIDNVPSNANGIHIPNKSDKMPPKKRITAPPPNCRVNIMPNVLPSTDSWVTSDTKEDNAGYVMKTDIPKRIKMKISAIKFVKYARSNPINPMVRYEKMMTFFLPRRALIFP